MMTNKYAGACFDCGVAVASGAGVAFKSGGRWLVACMAHKANAKETAGWRRRAGGSS